MRLLFEGTVMRGWQVVFRGGRSSKPMPKLVAATYVYYLDNARGMRGPGGYMDRVAASDFLMTYYDAHPAEA